MPNMMVFMFLLFADKSRFQHMNSRFSRPSGSFGFGDFVVMAAVFAGIALAIWLLAYSTRRLEQSRSYSPRGIFFGLCKAHKLSWGNRWLLWRLARAHRLKHPGRLFLEPERFESSKLPRGLKPHQKQLKALRARLFS